MKRRPHTGDDGTTSLSGGRRVKKHSDRVEAYGTIDELIAWFGLLRNHKDIKKYNDILIYIQGQLMSCAASLAYDRENPAVRNILPDNECVLVIEKEIFRMEEALTPLKSFIIPGGNELISYCHITRCICRRAERAVLRLNETEESPEIVVKFLNRLSDYLFVLSRKISLELNNEEITWPA
jgi:cob(I)alamin adenosyltransferase